ncbi:MAG: hypothetical protein RLZZ303_1415 [Candidatus Hydrogenedentota bacterium]|jgi:hypothetical protein
MKKCLALSLMAALPLAACGAKPATPEAPAPQSAAPAEAQAQPMEAAPDAPPPMRNFAALTIGPYAVQPMFEEEIKDGHFNIDVKGAEVKAVRIWVGPEDASGVMVAKTEPEHGYHHGHVEMPDPIPADAQLWIEIEAPDGTLHKGATPLVQAP